MALSFNTNSTPARGFSFIELLISMALMIILILGTAQLICHSLLVKQKSDCHIRAAELASQKLEHLRSLVFNTREIKEPRLEFIKDKRLNHEFKREWDLADISPDLKRIEMDCYALSNPRKRSRILLVITRELGF